MFAAAYSDPRQVTLQWLRLAGILALSMTGLGMFFLAQRTGGAGRGLWLGSVALAVLILIQLVGAQTGRLWLEQLAAGFAFLWAVVLGASLTRVPPIRQIDIGYGTAAGVSILIGTVLMDMLLGHAYLTAAKMTIAPFRRLNFVLGMMILVRAVGLAVGVPWAYHYRPVYLLWGEWGLLIITRVLVGLAVPGVFAYMAHDCIKRRATQSATGILYVAGVLVFIGELLALYLTRATGLPF